jgi:hypothetical protein
MGVKLVSASGGSVEINPPTTASNFIATMPAAAGTVVIQNASNNLLMNSGYGSDAVAYGCRAWVNFNGQGTVAIRASGNVTSITDNGTGDYTVNFTTAMPDANYDVALTAGYTTDGGNPSFGIANRIGTTGNEQAPTTSNFRFNVCNTTGNANDSKYVFASIFR